jgi:formylglycine-generating enzyme required for sulfatase activity
MREGTPVRGSGFVVDLVGDKATIVTAAHVIEGTRHLEVTFAADRSAHFATEALLGMEAGSRNGLAVFPVRGALPAGVTALRFEISKRPEVGEALFLAGFPQVELEPRATRRVLAGRRGTLLLIDQAVGEGFSGGPVLQAGAVVGVVTDTDEQTTYAVNAVVAREALEGWGIPLGGSGPALEGPPSATALPTVELPRSGADCAPGEERLVHGIIFVRVCAGTFTMGSTDDDPLAFPNEKPAHLVTLGEFWIAKTEMTNGQFRRFRPAARGDANLPVVSVSWEEAQAACQTFGGRLPTEAEWEYAACAGAKTAWSHGNDEEKLREYAWYLPPYRELLWKSPIIWIPVDPKATGLKKPNPWGVHDMHGNAWEWVGDWYGPYTEEAQSNPSGPETGEAHSVRGGSISSAARILRSAFRSKGSGGSRILSFRCVVPS